MKQIQLTIGLFMLLFFTVETAIAQNSPAPFPYIRFVLSPNHADWNYRTGEEAKVRITVLQNGVPMDNVVVDYDFGFELMKAEKTGNLTLDDGIGEISIGTSKVPGFRQLKVQAKFEGKTYKDEVKVAFLPDKIEPTVSLPADFLTYWDKAKADLAKIPMDAVVTHLPQYSTTTVNVFLVSLQNYKKGKRLYGYLCIPKAEGKYPVVLLPPGAGVKRIEPWLYYAEQGFISLSIEIHGISPEISVTQYKEISNAFGDYWLNNLDDIENYYYKSVYLGCVRSIDFLCSLPEFDGKNVLVTGGSQGGALAIVSASLDSRVTALVSFYPALCDLSGYLHGRAGGWPHLFSQRNQKVNATPEKINVAAYYDVVNFARHLNVPGFYSWGYNDNICPPTSVYSAINTIKAPKTVVITPITGHWRFSETDEQSVDWLKEQCK